MKNSDVSVLSRPLEKGEKIQEGDLYRSQENETLLWLEITKDYWGTEYDPTKHTLIRRPLPVNVVGDSVSHQVY